MWFSKRWDVTQNWIMLTRLTGAFTRWFSVEVDLQKVPSKCCLRFCW